MVKVGFDTELGGFHTECCFFRGEKDQLMRVNRIGFKIKYNRSSDD